MKVRDVMSTSVTTLQADTPLQVAASILVSHGHSATPVVDGTGHLVGMASEADLVRGRMLPGGWTVEIDPECVVAAVMTHGVVAAHPDDDLADVVDEMLDKGLRAVPVVEADDIVGIVTRRDVLCLVAQRRLLSEQDWTEREALVSQDRG
jgi:CBS domain-containing protein